jgi:hypothetical protein
MKASSKIFLTVTAVVALSVARPTLGNLMMNRDVQPRNFADRTLSTELSNTGPAWMANRSDDISRIEWRSDIEKPLIMRQESRNGLVRPPVDPSGVPVPGDPAGVNVPDGSTLLLLGLAFVGLGVLRPRLCC